MYIMYVLREKSMCIIITNKCYANLIYPIRRDVDLINFNLKNAELKSYELYFIPDWFIILSKFY